MINFVKLVEQIICEQEKVLGPIAWDIPNTITGLKIDLLTRNVSFEKNINIREVVNKLLDEYERLFGASVKLKFNKLITSAFIVNDKKYFLSELIEKEGISVTEKSSETALLDLEKVDAIIIDISDPDDSIISLIGQANTLQKPVLCLYKKNYAPRYLLNYLSNSSISKNTCVKSYTIDTVFNIINNFCYPPILQIVGQKPNIKFTLRLTPALEHYLNWLADNQKMNKADAVRKLITDKRNQDSHYLNRDI